MTYTDILESFFFYNNHPLASVERGVYQLPLILLSYVVASFASYTALSMSQSLVSARSIAEKRPFHWGGAFAMGAGIWSMHFIGMLSYKMHMLVEYDVPLTLLSLLIAIIIAYSVLGIVARDQLPLRRLLMGAVLLGLGICAMHYIGMAAMKMDGNLRYRPDIFFLSVAIAIAASGAALWISFTLARHSGRYRHLFQIGAALVMGAAICGMHYTGMAAAVFMPYADCRYDPDQTFDVLAVAIAGITGVILGITLTFADKTRLWPLSIKILLPLLIGGIVIIFLGWSQQKYQHMQEMEEQLARRASSIASGIEQFSWIVGISPEMRRVVDSLGAEKDVKKIAIFRLDPFKIVTNNGEELSTDTYEAYFVRWFPQKELLQALYTGKPFHLTFTNGEDGGTDYISVAPVLLREHDTGKSVPGVMFIQLEASDFINDMYSHMRQVTIGILFGILLILALTYQLLQRYIFQPVNNIKQTLDRRAKGDTSAYAGPLHPDEIGDVGRALNTLLDNQTQFEAEIKLSHSVAVKASVDAQKASAIKSQFLANMSHELRTPLNSMLGMTRLLLGTTLDKEQQEMVGTVFQSSRNLLEIVNDILDLSKIEADEMQLERIGFDVTYIFNSVIHVLRPLAKEKNMRLDIRFEKEDFPYLIGDPLRMTRVLMNMIGNAVKYTDRGHVELRAFCKKLDDNHVELRAEVEDTGIGIAEEKLDKIFEKFVQADTSTTRRYGGTGLGLAITKELIELMGGRIGVDSEVDKGSTFWFTIPFEITDQLSEEKRIRKSKRAKGEMPPEKARILVAEDHPLNQIFIKKLMEKFGIGYFEIVNNGQEAVNKYLEGAWDVILMDCHMPEKNGYDATEEIRSFEEKTGKHVSIVAMTANAMTGEREKCFRYGMDDYISKPINLEEMQDILGQWLHFADSAEKSPELEFGTTADPPVNLSQLRDITDGDKDLDKEFVRVFVTQSDENLKILEECCASGDNKQWGETAHMLKGGSGTVGAKTLSELCEKAQHFDGNGEERRVLFGSIKHEYERAKDFLRQNGFPV